jgi:hypothetical protein
MTPIRLMAVQSPVGRPLAAMAMHAQELPKQQPVQLPVQPRPAGVEPTPIDGAAGTIDLRV